VTRRIDALAALRGLGVPVVETGEAAAVLSQTTRAASMTLSRLAAANLVRPIRHGVWWIDGDVRPLRLPEYLTAPLPSYVSLHTALQLRGMVEQIPSVIYAVTLARRQRITTTVATYSFHHVAPELYGGWEETHDGVKLATAEKALFDVAYLSGGRSRLFASLPELEIPRRFRKQNLFEWVDKIASARARTLTHARLTRWLASARRTN
jgi:predicted transcriptional regulator of viral defense system